MISTRDLSLLFDVDGLRRLLQAMAVLACLLCPEWEYRYYSFNARWGQGEQLASMRDGEGDHFFALFNSHGCFLKGFAHESAMSPFAAAPECVWPGVLDGVPPAFAACLREPAFNLDETTFCVWREYGDAAWRHGPVSFPSGDDPDGSADLLSPLDGEALQLALEHGLVLVGALVRQVGGDEAVAPGLPLFDCGLVFRLADVAEAGPLHLQQEGVLAGAVGAPEAHQVVDVDGGAHAVDPVVRHTHLELSTAGPPAVDFQGAGYVDVGC